MSWDAVRAWRDRLRADTPPTTRLSPAGARHILTLALDALTDDALDAAAAIPGAPILDAAFVAARTVHTAPLPWLAVLLGRGGRVLLKAPRGEPGFAPWYTDHATRVGLPLRWSEDRDEAVHAELVIAMGADATVASIRDAARPGATVLTFGHRFSAAWLAAGDDPSAVARDLAAHDTRGCFSPAIVFTPDAGTIPALCDAMASAEARWPRGELADAEHAALRARRARARVAGAAWEGPGWSVHQLPIAGALPAALPRSAQVVVVDDPRAAWQALAPWQAKLSTWGANDPSTAPPWPGVQTAALGQMQAPPLLRPHDGVDWLRATLKHPG
jgi:hypothetical protein